MNRLDLALRIRAYSRDFTNATFRDQDIVSYINEAIDRSAQIIPELRGMIHLPRIDSEVILLPKQYHHLLAVYGAARCFEQDERHFQAGNLMNEFETKMFALKADIESGSIDIIDPTTGLPVEMPYAEESVRDVYFDKRRSY